MSDKKGLWYANGLRFECTGCGRCCVEPRDGVVYVTRADVRRLAKALGLSEAACRSRYTRKSGRRRVLKGDRRGACKLLGEDMKTCTVHEDKPEQCRSFPWWEESLATVEAWVEEARRCEGVGRGPLISAEEIAARAKRPR
jgi:Fe-S-cluster containining protein